MKHRLGICCLLFLFTLIEVYSQTGLTNQNNTTNITELTMLARSAPTYPVTAGDVYILTYAVGNTVVSYTIPVDASYKIRIANLGIIEAAGKTFLQLKNEIESLVSRNHTMSGAQVQLMNVAIFNVVIKGEVLSTVNMPVWALSRLSSVLQSQGLLTPYASFRDVTITSAGGRVRTYDLFKANRFGDLTQDPYLRPGDTITVKRYTRSVTIEGGIERPGTYQLLNNENLKALIEIYGNGFTAIADKSRLELVRYVNSASISGDKIYLDEEAFIRDYALQDYDKVIVPEITSLLPVMFIEGAIGSSEDAAVNVSTRITVRFNKGENYASLVKGSSGLFSAVSDIQNAYIIRNEDRIPVNLTPMLYDIEYKSDYLVEENDILIIPFRQYFITVAGSVITPGRYPYIPDRNWDYYIALAGGFIQEKNVRQTVRITDFSGKPLSKKDIITPETIITAGTNSFLYYFNQYAPIITTFLTVLTTSLTLYTLLNR